MSAAFVEVRVPERREEAPRRDDLGPWSLGRRSPTATPKRVMIELLEGSGIELLDEAAVIARTHPERYDGTGYPRALTRT